MRRLSDWLDQQPGLRPVASSALSALLPEAQAWRAHASGLLAVRLAGDQPLSLLWFRSEILETIRWAGDPSTAVKSAADGGALTPRASFEGWSQTVTGRARRWSAAAVESAARLRDALFDFAAVNQLRSQNQSLQARLTERDLRLEQQQFLMREVNHRVQNSLTLVSSFLGLQARDLGDSPAGSALQRRRVAASMPSRPSTPASIAATKIRRSTCPAMSANWSTTWAPAWAPTGPPPSRPIWPRSVSTPAAP